MAESAVPPSADGRAVARDSLRALLADVNSSYASQVRGYADLVGGADALEQLDDIPHPDEPFDWDGIAAERHAVVEAVLDALEAGVTSAPYPGLAEIEAEWRAEGRSIRPRVDPESVTIARRLLRRVAMHGFGELRRSPPRRTAARIAWLALRANGNVGRRAPVSTDHLWRMFGVTAASGRWRELVEAAGLPIVDRNPHSGRPLEPWLADVALLHSRQRHHLVAQVNACITLREREVQRREAARPVRVRPDGLEVRASVLTPVSAHLGVGNGTRAYVAVVVRESDGGLDAFALSVPDARALIEMLRNAVDGPLPAALRGPAVA